MSVAGRKRKKTNLSGSTGPSRRGKKRRSGISARERNLRRLESNERERMRMHSLNKAFQVGLGGRALIEPYNLCPLNGNILLYCFVN